MEGEINPGGQTVAKDNLLSVTIWKEHTEMGHPVDDGLDGESQHNISLRSFPKWLFETPIPCFTLTYKLCYGFYATSEISIGGYEGALSGVLLFYPV